MATRRLMHILAATSTVVISLTIVGAVAAAAAGELPVRGGGGGTGGFRFGTCPLVQEVADGTLHASLLGPATYHTEACVSVSDRVYFDGTFVIRAAGGSLTGTISFSYPFTGPLVRPLVVTGGTGRFAHWRGTFLLGPVETTDFSACRPDLVCTAWRETLGINGSLTRVG